MRDDRRKGIKNTVREAIDVLLHEAIDAREKNEKRANRYVEMAWELVKKHKIALNQRQKALFCRKCLVLWIPAKTVRVIFDAKSNSFRLECMKCKYQRTAKSG